MTIVTPTDLNTPAISTAQPEDFFQLLKPRVMSLVVFTAATGLVVAPGSINPLVAAIAVLCIAVGAGAAGALKELEAMQKSRATRIKRDSLDQALLDLAAFYRDVLAIQFGARVELATEDRRSDLEAVARESTPEDTLRRIDAIMQCRERLAANANPQIAVEAMTLALRSPRAAAG